MHVEVKLNKLSYTKNEILNIIENLSSQVKKKLYY